MAITYPTTIDSLTNPSSTDTLDSPSHSDQHADINDAVEALEAKVGVDSSAVATSVDYKLTNTSSSNPGHKHTLANGATDVTSSTEELNKLDGTDATKTDFDKLHDITSTATELNQLDDVTVGGSTSGDIVTTNDTQTLTNKTIDGDDNTLQDISGTAIKTSGIIFASWYNTTVTFNPGDANNHYITGWTVSVTVPSGSPDVLVEFGNVSLYHTTYGASPRLYRDTTFLHGYSSEMRLNSADVERMGTSWMYIDSSVSAGTYDYKVGLAASGGVSPNIDILSSYIKCTVLI